MSDDDLYDEADRILIRTVEKANKAGVGRTFRSPAGQTVRVTAIDEKWITMVPMVNGVPIGETLHLPRDVRRIATATALARRNMIDAATRRN